MLKLLTELKGHDDRVWCVAWNPKGNLLASCGGDHNVKIWHEEIPGKWTCLATLTGGHTRTIRWVSWSPCGNKLATASFDTTIVIWKRRNDSTFEIIANLEGHENEVKCTAWSNDGAFLASCSRDRSVWIWDVNDEDEEYECSSVLTIHSQDVKHVQWHPNQNLLASSSYDNTIKICEQDVDDWICTSTLESHESTVWSSDFNPDGSLLISCSDDRSLKLWRPTNESDNKSGVKTSKWSCISTITGHHTRTIFSVKWSRALTNIIATSSADNSIHIFKYNTTDSSEQPTLSLLHHEQEAHSQDCNCVDWNPTRGDLLASCSDDGTIKIWSFAFQE